MVAHVHNSNCFGDSDQEDHIVRLTLLKKITKAKTGWGSCPGPFALVIFQI
jgi:hypothetical protein